MMKGPNIRTHYIIIVLRQICPTAAAVFVVMGELTLHYENCTKFNFLTKEIALIHFKELILDILGFGICTKLE